MKEHIKKINDHINRLYSMLEDLYMSDNIGNIVLDDIENKVNVIYKEINGSVPLSCSAPEKRVLIKFILEEMQEIKTLLTRLGWGILLYTPISVVKDVCDRHLK